MLKKLVLLLLFPATIFAQKKQVTLDDIYKNGTFSSEKIETDFEETKPMDWADKISSNNVNKPSGFKAEKASDIVPNATNQYAFIKTDEESIYRHSSKSRVYLFNTKTNNIFLLDSQKVLHPSFSPDGSKLAFVKNNNLYTFDLSTNKIQAITTDGKWNEVINGNCDWVYEEEFSFTQAYQWSPKGNYIAYYRFDESKVKEYSFTEFDDGYNKEYRYKYPKAGEANSTVEIYICEANTGKKIKAKYETGDIYIPRIKWTTDNEKLAIYHLNRHQNHLKILLADAQSGSTSTLYEEKNKYYVEINDDLKFLDNSPKYIFTSEKDGYNQIYCYSLDGKIKTQITTGKYDVSEITAIDEKNGNIYYTLAYPRPMDRNVFVSSLDGKKTAAITTGNKWHEVKFNNDFTKFYEITSDINTPKTVVLKSIATDKKKNISIKTEKTISENDKLKSKLSEYGMSKAEFLRIPNSKGDTLNGWVLRPANFDVSKKYPVLFCNYGGPGSQQVANRFGAASYWHQLLAQQGFIVVSVDNTGTGFRGEEFKKKTYLQLGKFEIEDQIDAAKYIKKFSFVDTKNIGHWGWSFGGFMSALAITKGSDVFSAAVSVAPVTSWRYYDNIYTERFMRTPQENQKGYDENAPVNFTDKIKGKYLIIHGTGDDNVHFQNATQMITAMVKSNIDFESAYYPNKNHGIGGWEDNTTYHIWNKMTNWIIDNLGNENTKKLNSKVSDGDKF